MRTCEGHIAA